MAKNRPRSLFSRIVDLKPGEGAISLFLFTYFFLITAPYYIIKSMRNANFLEQQGVKMLPLAYFLTAVLMGFVVNFHSRIQVRLSRRVLIISSLIFFLLTSVAFWWLFKKDWHWVSVVYWVWANVFAIVLVTQFWILVNDVFNPREAKRLIGFIGSGAQLGAIIGGLMAGRLAKTKAGAFLLLIAAGLVFLGILAAYCIFVWRRRRPPEEEPDRKDKTLSIRPGQVGFRDSFNTVRQSSYLKTLSGVVIVTLLVSTLIDQQFNMVVKESGRVNNLTSFFGYFNAATMAFALFFQLLMTSPIIRSFGIRASLLFYPFILFLGSVGIGAVAYANIVPAILIKASDKSLAYSLNQSVRELLYIPISPEQKYKAKVFIDMFLNRFAKGLGAVILVILLNIASERSAIRLISVAVLLFIAAWIALNLRVGREYTSIVKEKIKPKWERADLDISQKLDVDYAKLVFDTLESKDRSSVLYAMNLFDLIKQDKLTAEVKKLIAYKSDEIRAASLGTLFEQGETGLGPEIEDDLSEEVLKKEVQEIMNLDVYQQLMKDYFEKTIAASGEESVIAKMEAAKAIGFMNPQAPAVETLDDLLEDESPEVGRLAIQSSAALKRREDVPILVRKLRSPVLREDAKEALKKYGPRIVGTLADHLADPNVDLEVRKSVASVLAGIGTQDAADFLIWELAGAEGELADEIIDALDRIRTGQSGIRFSEDAVKSRINHETQAYCRNLILAYEKKRDDPNTAPDQKWEKKQADTLSNIFKLLGLIYGHEDMSKAYQNLKTGAKDAVAYALELLDNVLEKEIREIVFPVIEDLPPEEKARKCRHLLNGLAEGKHTNDRD